MSLIACTCFSSSNLPLDSRKCSSSNERSKWSSRERLPRPVTIRMSVSPAPTASSTTYWIDGLSTTGSIAFCCAFVAGRKRVPRPAAGMTAFLTGMKRPSVVVVLGSGEVMSVGAFLRVGPGARRASAVIRPLAMWVVRTDRRVRSPRMSIVRTERRRRWSPPRAGQPTGPTPAAVSPLARILASPTSLDRPPGGAPRVAAHRDRQVMTVARTGHANIGWKASPKVGSTCVEGPMSERAAKRRVAFEPSARLDASCRPTSTAVAIAATRSTSSRR